MKFPAYLQRLDQVRECRQRALSVLRRNKGKPRSEWRFEHSVETYHAWHAMTKLWMEKEKWRQSSQD